MSFNKIDFSKHCLCLHNFDVFTRPLVTVNLEPAYADIFEKMTAMESLFKWIYAKQVQPWLTNTIVLVLV